MAHHTGDAANAKPMDVINYVVNNPEQSSYHVMIHPNGDIYEIADLNKVTWHAGE